MSPASIWTAAGTVSNLGRRVVTALILVPLFLAALFGLSGWAFAVFLGLILLLGAWEWGGLCGLDPVRRGLWLFVCTLLAGAVYLLQGLLLASLTGVAFWIFAIAAVIVFPRGQAFWATPAVRLASGLLVLVPAWAALLLLQAMPHGPWLVLWTMLMVWGSDIGGYFFGRAWGRHKLAPAVSPGKTVEGLLGGVAAALLLSLIMVLVAGLPVSALFGVMVITLLVVAAAVFGDLFESLIKRVAGVKDSGSLLPGHGGVLDRIDAVLAAAPVAAVLLHQVGSELLA
ncbi:MAG: phosphatidate cytidylyltransferase [Gammaproteobacteria bacterium]|nr:phosphatidate cytidylyltransferase [Gammaproteobacteria bacterium]